MPDSQEELSPEEIAKRMDHALRRSLTMKPEHTPSKTRQPRKGVAKRRLSPRRQKP
jgi:hypothetical protein